VWRLSEGRFPSFWESSRLSISLLWRSYFDMSTSQLFSKLARQALWSDKNPSVLPIPAIQSGNNVSFSENKTKRKWQPNVKAHDWPVTILGGEEGRRSKKMPVIRMKTQIGKLREYERAGGVEGILVCD